MEASGPDALDIAERKELHADLLLTDVAVTGLRGRYEKFWIVPVPSPPYDHPPAESADPAGRAGW
jgi:hypothetical protein